MHGNGVLPSKGLLLALCLTLVVLNISFQYSIHESLHENKGDDEDFRRQLDDLSFFQASNSQKLVVVSDTSTRLNALAYVAGASSEICLSDSAAANILELGSWMVIPKVNVSALSSDNSTNSSTNNSNDTINLNITNNSTSHINISNSSNNSSTYNTSTISTYNNSISNNISSSTINSSSTAAGDVVPVIDFDALPPPSAYSRTDINALKDLSKFMSEPLAATIDNRPRQELNDVHSSFFFKQRPSAISGCAFVTHTMIFPVSRLDFSAQNDAPSSCRVCIQLSTPDGAEERFPAYSTIAPWEESNDNNSYTPSTICLEGVSNVTGLDIESVNRIKDGDRNAIKATVSCKLPPSDQQNTFSSCESLASVNVETDDDVQRIYLQAQVTLKKIQKIKTKRIRHEVTVKSEWPWESLAPQYYDHTPKSSAKLPNSPSELRLGIATLMIESSDSHPQILESLVHQMHIAPRSTRIIGAYNGHAANLALRSINAVLDNTTVNATVLRILEHHRHDDDTSEVITLRTALEIRGVQILFVTFPIRSASRTKLPRFEVNSAFESYVSARYASEFNLILYLDAMSSIVAAPDATLPNLQTFMYQHLPQASCQRFAKIVMQREERKDSFECTSRVLNSIDQWNSKRILCSEEDTGAAFITRDSDKCTSWNVMNSTEFAQIELSTRTASTSHPECNC